MINPKVLAETVEVQEDWETSLCVPHVKSLCKRPTEVKVAYIDDSGYD